MGVNNLWKALAKENAVQQLSGSIPRDHAKIIEAVENKVVAVDLSAWLMQAQTQPALLENYDSPYARACKVVFDRTIHWLRYGCLPVFVIEGKTPPAKLAKLQQRCVAQYGPTARSYDVGNRAGGQFDKLGQAVKRLLEAFGVPCVQAVGEGEAMCAALNLCGWAHACHTLDVDALLFGALTVYRQLHLQTDDPRKSTLVRCDRSEVQKVLGIKRGGDAALVAVAQLAGGDYDTAGAEQVGENLALAAVRCLLRGCEDDETVLQNLEAALAAGSNPELDALTNCTGCKACGHEGGMKSRIKQHTSRHGGCAACGSSSACIPREWQQCECAFHRRADERLLNRVVRRAVQTPGFIASCRTAAATYSDQLRQAIAAVQREYGLPVDGSTSNVFKWRHRPDARLISDTMCKYIKDWDYNQVRLKLLPLLLEWDMRQGPHPSPSAGVHFRPTGIRKVSSKGAAEDGSIPARQQQGWRYVLLVERIQQQQLTGVSSSAPPVAAVDASLQDSQEAEDLAVDLAWIAGTARSKPPKAPPTAAAWGTAAAAESSGAGLLDAEGELSSQVCYFQYTATQGCTGTHRCSQAASGGHGAGSGGSRSGGSLQFSEHRSVRCSLMDAVWPAVVEAYRNPPAAGSGRARSGSSRRKAAAAAGPPATEDKQRSLKDFFGTVKDYTATAKPTAKRNAMQPAADGSIPGLAGIGTDSIAAAAAAADGAVSKGFVVSPTAPVVAAAAAETAVVDPHAVDPHAVDPHAADWQQSTTKQPSAGQSFMDWLDPVTHETPGQQANKQQQHPEQLKSQQDVWGYGEAAAAVALGSPVADRPQKQQAVPPAAALVADDTASAQQLTAGVGRTSERVFVGARSSRGMHEPAAGTAASCACAGQTRSNSLKGRGPGKKQVMPAGALERFLQPAASTRAASGPSSSTDEQQQRTASGSQQQQQEKPVKLQQSQQAAPAGSPLKRPIAPIDCCSDSPEVLPLAARLQARSKLGVVSSSAVAVTAEAAADAGGVTHRAKKVETNRARELLNSPATSPANQPKKQLAHTAASQCVPKCCCCCCCWNHRCTAAVHGTVCSTAGRH